MMLQTQEIRIRDPYVVAWEGKYYMYSSTAYGQGCGKFDDRYLEMVVYVSGDLLHWEQPKVVFHYEPGENTPLREELWAPEVHCYRGKFYAFLSVKNSTGWRGTYIAVSDRPDGIFRLLSEEPATPVEVSAIDGTLYEEEGIPYIVYSLDWPGNFVEAENAYVGEIWARRLKEDLSGGEGEPFRLFASCDVPISRATPHRLEWEGKPAVRYGSDAPFLTRLTDGTLFLTWSPYLHDNYVVLGAVSESGTLQGPWRHLEKPLFADNGGHAMVFRDFDGTRKMCIHQPEAWGEERMCCMEVAEQNGELTIKDIIGK